LFQRQTLSDPFFIFIFYHNNVGSRLHFNDNTELLLSTNSYCSINSYFNINSYFKAPTAPTEHQQLLF